MSKKTSAKRKLLPKHVLDTCFEHYSLGVPVSKLLVTHDLDTNRVTLSKLLAWYQDTSVHESLFPPWLDDAISQVQTNPDGWTYIGYFPQGYWQYDN